MPKSTVESVLSNTKTLVRETLSVVRTHIQDSGSWSERNFPRRQCQFFQKLRNCSTTTCLLQRTIWIKVKLKERGVKIQQV